MPIPQHRKLGIQIVIRRRYQRDRRQNDIVHERGYDGCEGGGESTINMKENINGLIHTSGRLIYGRTWDEARDGREGWNREGVE